MNLVTKKFQKNLFKKFKLWVGGVWEVWQNPYFYYFFNPSLIFYVVGEVMLNGIFSGQNLDTKSPL